MEELKSSHNELQTCMHEIEEAVCFVSGMHRYENYPLYKERWNFLYYGIGNILLNNEETKGKFKELLCEIWQKIKSSYESNGCNITCKPIDKNIFLHKKTIFDFSHNYNTIKGYLGEYWHDCEKGWTPHKEEITEACKAVQQHCEPDRARKNTADPYCTGPYMDYTHYCKMHLQTLKCRSQTEIEEIKRQACFHVEDPLQKELEQKSNLLREAEANIRSATTTSSISSIIGTLGLTVAPYVLYKYKPWSSWFGNHSSRGGRGTRKKISTVRNIDALTEDSSTIGASTTEDDSILGWAPESSTVSSSAYTRQSTRGEGRTSARRTNNSTQGRPNIGYQNILNKHIRKEYSQSGCGKRS
ncbi:KIR-like protein [Plasmodium coatneyi]|uniref:KIR-like protein n=1 Tax=Plasmodium coatneyi TaxID=208452 RepID=A0A1B1E3R6_9APIC|nr:KIR-like protein [Plasmodium coatneyi]ANQ09646.1 KIR-like protein [Plasmodium coatneyi]